MNTKKFKKYLINKQTYFSKSYMQILKEILY